MQIENLITVKSREDLRVWLQENCKNEQSCWVLVSMIPNPETLLYLDVVEECLCFGWIDGVKKKVSETELRSDCLPEANEALGQN